MDAALIGGIAAGVSAGVAILGFLYKVWRDSHRSPTPTGERSVPNGSPGPQPTDRFDARPAANAAGLVGRAADLKRLRGLAKRNRVVVLYGGAGMGKTRLAVEHTHLNEPRGFWTTGGDSLDATFGALAPHVGVDVKDKEAD